MSAAAALEEKNRRATARRRAVMERDDWEPIYERWRHGGWYVVNVVFPGGGCGCVASNRHTRSGKWESACFSEAIPSSRTRRAAALAEREHAIKLWKEHDERENNTAPGA